MRIETLEDDKTLYISMSGELDHHSAETLKKDIDLVIMNSRNADKTTYVFDMREVTFMDSSGLGVLLGRYRLITDRHGKMMIVNASRVTDKILRMSGVYALLDKQADGGNK